jgi:hypothetical protein
MNYFNGYLLLFAVFIAIQYYRLGIYKKRTTALYTTQQNIYSSVPQRSYFSFFVRTIFLVVAWVLLAICLTKLDSLPVTNSASAPQNTHQTLSELPKIDEMAFVLDLSASMNAKDTSNAESRLAKAKEIISSLIEDLGGINASLIGFTANCQTIVPDTLDYLYFRILMDSAGVNDTGEAGTNLLAMVDAIKAKYVNSTYRKSVRVVLLTDGEDTGFLGMDDSSRAKAENVLIEHVAATVSDTLQWEVIGLGSLAGAQVPDVTFESKPVVSCMKSALLQAMAKAGNGHFYAEVDVPVTEICDDLLADIAVSTQSQGGKTSSTISSFAPRITLELSMLLAFAALLLFASLILPQDDKRVAL